MEQKTKEPACTRSPLGYPRLVSFTFHVKEVFFVLNRMRVLRGPEFISVPLISSEKNLAKQHRSRLLQQICLSLPTPARPLTARVPALPDPAARPGERRGRRALSPGRWAPGHPGTALRARPRPSFLC